MGNGGLKGLVLVVALVGASGPLAAGIYYESSHRSEGGGQGVHEFEIHGWAEGDRAKIEFVTSAANEVMCGGCYLLTEDAGQTLYLVDPNKETYSRWDLDAVLGMVGSVMNSGLVNMEFSTPQSEKLLDEAGEEILGRPTTHIRWRNRYDVKLKVIGFKQSNSIDLLQDFWVTDELPDRGLGVWLRSEPPKTGNASFDEMLSSEMSRVTGLPLRSTTVTTTVNKKGKSTVTSDEMRVTKLESMAIAEETFQLPSGFEEVPMMPGMAAADEDEPQGPLKGLKGMLRKRGD